MHICLFSDPKPRRRYHRQPGEPQTTSNVKVKNCKSDETKWLWIGTSLNLSLNLEQEIAASQLTRSSSYLEINLYFLET